MDYSDFYKGKSILVTGGTGSIGNELVKKILQMDIKIIRVLDNNETSLFDLGQELNSRKLRLFIGDIRDEERLNRAMEGIDIVFHTAALKHVPLCEYNPFDAVKTNILGTQNILNAALNNNVEKVILISTDKAANPTNVMGATKLLAERLTLAANSYIGERRRTVFSCVRFGNVLGSRGSVIPIFIHQIKNGGPITITDPEMTRFIMSIPKSVDLILKAGKLSRFGEIFILKMPVINIMDLAKSMVRYFSNDSITKDIDITIIGKRPGEKLFEELMTDLESEQAYENEEMFVINADKPYSNVIFSPPEGFTKTSRKKYLSSDETPLSQDEIIQILKLSNLKE